VFAWTGFPAYVPLPPRCQIPSVRALGQDSFHLRFVLHAGHTVFSPAATSRGKKGAPSRTAI